MLEMTPDHMQRVKRKALGKSNQPDIVQSLHSTRPLHRSYHCRTQSKIEQKWKLDKSRLHTNYTGGLLQRQSTSPLDNPNRFLTLL